MLKRYTTYSMAFKIAQQQHSLDKEGGHAYAVFPWVQWPPDSNDFSQAVQRAVMESLKNHHEIAAQLLHNEIMAKEFSRFLLGLILIKPDQ